MFVPYYIIASCTEDGGISINGKLPWNYSEDMKFFRKTTIGDGNNVVVMGRKTYFSIPEKHRPLKNRVNIVLTREPGKYSGSSDTRDNGPDSINYVQTNENVIFTDSYESVFEIVNNLIDSGKQIEKIFNIGGKQLYEYGFNDEKLDGMYLTRIFKNYVTDEDTKCCFFKEEHCGNFGTRMVNSTYDFRTMFYSF